MRKKLAAMIIFSCLIAINFTVPSAALMKKDILTTTGEEIYLGSKNNSMTLKTSNGKIIYVDDDAGAGGDGSKEHPYSRIQDAINAASNGDTIYVYSGKYYENVVVDKSVSLIGESKYTTIIDGNGNGTVIWIKVSYVNVSGFTVRGSGTGEWPTSYYGIEVMSQHWYYPPLPERLANIHISDCIIEDNDVGIRLYTVSNSSIENCEIGHNLYGIIIYESSHNITIKNCYIHHCYIVPYSSTAFMGGLGIECWGFRNNFCSNISITYCNISHNEFVGIAIENCRNVKIRHNNIIHDKKSEGIDVKFSSNIHISDCVIEDNRRGIRLYTVSNSSIENCEIGHNLDGIIIYESSHNITIKNCYIHHNEFVGIAIENCRNVKIRHNNIIHDKKSEGIDVKFSSNIHISDCVIEDNRRGIRLYTVSNSSIENCEIGHNLDGIIIYESSHNITIKNCYIHHNEFVGIAIENCRNVKIRHNNIIHDKKSEGIDVKFSSNIHISDCVIEDNRRGIRLYTVSNSSIENCEIGHNLDGIIIYESSHNITIKNCYIHHNEFVGIAIENCRNVKIRHNNIIHDKKSEGIDVKFSSHVDARFNWWGDTVWQDFFYFLRNKISFKVRFSYFFPWRLFPVLEAGVKDDSMSFDIFGRISS